jgi:hypothetical protein
MKFHSFSPVAPATIDYFSNDSDRYATRVELDDDATSATTG